MQNDGMKYTRQMQRDDEKAQRRVMKQNLQHMLESGVRFQIVRPDFETQKGGGAVFAYKHTQTGDILVAASYCHKDDQFKKLDGKLLAGYRLEDGDYSLIIPKANHHRVMLSTFLDHVAFSKDV